MGGNESKFQKQAKNHGKQDEFDKGNADYINDPKNSTESYIEHPDLGKAVFWTQYDPGLQNVMDKQNPTDYETLVKVDEKFLGLAHIFMCTKNKFCKNLPGFKHLIKDIANHHTSRHPTWGEQQRLGSKAWGFTA